MKLNPIACAVLGALLLGGCAHEEAKKRTDDLYAQYDQTISKKTAELHPEKAEPRATLTRAKGAWLGSKAVPLAQEAQLPPAFSKDVVFVFPGRVNLRTIAERITKVTGIPVRLKPDVFMPTSMFVGGTTGIPGMAVAGQPMVPAPQPGYAGLPPIPGMGLLGATAYQQIQNTSDEMELNYTGTLTGLLNMIGSRFGINWDYSNVDGILYSRMVTRTFVVKANPGDSSFTASLGKGSGSATGSFSSDGQVKMNSTFSVWDGIQKAMESIKTQAGKVTVSQATGSVTITDTKEVVDQAEKIIRAENAMLTKQVAVTMEIFSVTNNEDVQAGVDWNLVFTKFSQLAPQFSLKLVSPTTLATSAAGTMGMSILAAANSDSSVMQRLNGSEAFFRALQGEGKVARLQSVSAMTLNRQPVPIGVTNQQTYLARTTPTSGGVSGVALPGLEPGQVTTGFLANLLPTVLDNNSVLLQFSIDMSELESMGTVSSGSGATVQMINTPNVNGVQFVQRVALQPGNTLVLTGYERIRDSYDKNGLTKSIGLGGSLVGKKTREAIVILLTPTIVDGA